MNRQKAKGNLMMLLTAMIWGVAFAAQSSAMDSIGPLTFITLRHLMGAVVVLPVILLFSSKEKSDKTLWIGGVCCGTALFVASAFQQIGIQYTTTAKAGFITALYVIFVPLLELFRKKRQPFIVWLGVGIAVVGFYFLCMRGTFRLQIGDLLMLCCAVCFSFHILIIDYFSPKVDSIKLSGIQFVVAGAWSVLPMFLFEHPSVKAITAAWLPVLYVGIFSTGVAYTLQILAQKFTEPVMVSLIGSLESVFAALAGFVCWKLGLISNGSLSLQELFGCILVFAAIILVQLPTPQNKK